MTDAAVLISGSHGSIFALLQTHASGISAEIKTADNLVVTVKMQEPLQEPLSGLVEFHGTVQGKNTVLSDFYVSFPPEFTKDFGMFHIATLQSVSSFSEIIKLNSYCLLGGIAHGIPYTVTITDLLCFPI
jgi:hypothetical protein